ncbi:MAG: hypothetical protein JXX28_10575 [Deltaproteobacteria bacterium]|nr:hypothetical protein [Deltaproteobacteria bacterium]
MPVLIVLALIALAAGPLARREVDAELSLGQVDSGFIPDSFRVSPDQRSVTWVSRVTGGQVRVAVNGRYGPLYDDVAVGTPIFSPDSRQVAYLARRGESWHMVTGGREGPPLPGFLEQSLAFSADGNSLVVGVQVHEHWWMPMVERDGGPLLPLTPASLSGPVEPLEDLFDRIATPLLLGADGAPFFAARAGHRWVVVRGGERSEGWDGVEATFLSPAGDRVAYVAREGEERFAVVEGVRSQAWDEVDSDLARFSPQGRFVYPALGRGGWWVVVDGVPVGPWEAIGSDLVFSPDGAHVAWTARNEDRWRVVVDGAREELTDEPVPGSLTLSPGGERAAWAAQVEGGVRVVVDGEAGPLWDELRTGLSFSPDGAHLAWGVRAGDRQLVVVDQQAGPPSSSLLTLGGASLSWLSARRLAYMVLRGDRLIRVEEELCSGE